MAYDFQPLTVAELKNINFTSLPLDEQISILRRGRPTPDLIISQEGVSNNKKYVRRFNTSWYFKKTWLCGCKSLSALFCFPCMLFGGDETWTRSGFVNINKLKEKTEKHETTEQHITNVMYMLLTGKTRTIKLEPDDEYENTISQHNLKVKMNREILSKIVDCIVASGNFAYPLQALNENDNLENTTVLRRLIFLSCKFDQHLKNHVETSPIFKGISKAFLEEVLDCLHPVYHEAIKLEIRESSFVYLMVDDVTDVSVHTSFAIVVRYVFKEEIFERFWGFFIPEDQTVQYVTKCILEQLSIILEGQEEKLIGFSFDNSCPLHGKRSKMAAKIKAVYGNAHFIHCYTHVPHTVIKNISSNVSRHARVFFSNFMTIPAFFLKTQYIDILEKNTDIRVPLRSKCWEIFTIANVFQNVASLKRCLSEIKLISNNDSTIADASAVLSYLENDEFLFWLNFFNQVVSPVEAFYKKMHSPSITTKKISEFITDFKNSILSIKHSDYCMGPSELLTSNAQEICYRIATEVIGRYAFFNHLFGAKVLRKANFGKFAKNMPEADISIFTDAYPVLDKEKIKTDLKVYFHSPILNENSSLIELLQFITENNLNEPLSDLTIMIKILLTIPMPTTDYGRCFPTMSRIRNFLRCSEGSEKLSAFGVVHMENHFLEHHLMIKETIVDVFSEREARKNDFIFK